MEKLDVDKVLNLVGGWGKFQLRAYIPLCFVVIVSVFQMGYIFVARDTKYRCRIPSCRNDSESYNTEWLINAVPHKDGVPSRCLFYQPAAKDTCTNFYKNVTNTCSDFVFEKNQTTIVQDFNITCDENLWKLTIVGSINAIGELVCLPISGFISDRYGRKFMIMVGMFFTTLWGLSKSFAPWYSLYVTFEFLDAALGSGIYSGAFILALEIVDTSKRSRANTVICLAFVVGQVILGLSAWFSPSWRIMLRVIYTPGILILISLWFVPESIRWLISKNKMDKAWKIIKKASKANKKSEIHPALFISSEVSLSKNEEKNVVPFRKVLKSKTLLIRIIHCAYTWLCCNFPYYGLTIQSVALSEDVYINFICTALIEVPAYILTQNTIDRFGRRRTLAYSLLMSGVSCILVYFSIGSSWLSLVIFLTGKFFITIAYTTIYIYTAEMFPTELRHSVFAICSMGGRLGTILAPQVPLLERVFKSLPLFIFSAMAMTSGVLAFWFPETLNSELPDDIDEAENI